MWRCFKILQVDSEKNARPCLQILTAVYQDALNMFQETSIQPTCFKSFQFRRYKRSKFGGTSEPAPWLKSSERLPKRKPTQRFSSPAPGLWPVLLQLALAPASQLECVYPVGALFISPLLQLLQLVHVKVSTWRMIPGICLNETPAGRNPASSSKGWCWKVCPQESSAKKAAWKQNLTERSHSLTASHFLS